MGYDNSLQNEHEGPYRRTATVNDDTYIVPVEVLCITCKQPIKGWVNSPQWLRVEWISPQGECRACDQQGKESKNVVVPSAS